MASSFDLVSLSDLKDWLSLYDTDADDGLLARMITSISRSILTTINRSSIYPSAASDLIDGNGKDSVVLRRYPVLAVSAVEVNGQAIPAVSAGDTVARGFILDATDPLPPGRPQMITLRGYCFPSGRRNVRIDYQAGYQTSEVLTVPAADPFSVTLSQPLGAWGSDVSVSDAVGPYTAVIGAPAPRCYSASAGTYAFNAADAGSEVTINYGFIPHDLAQACMEYIGARFFYRSANGLKQKTLSGGETWTFQPNATTPFVQAVLQQYANVVPW